MLSMNFSISDSAASDLHDALEKVIDRDDAVDFLTENEYAVISLFADALKLRLGLVDVL